MGLVKSILHEFSRSLEYTLISRVKSRGSIESSLTRGKFDEARAPSVFAVTYLRAPLFSLLLRCIHITIVIHISFTSDKRNYFNYTINQT